MSLVAYGSSDESEDEIPEKKAIVNQRKTKESVKIRIPSLKEFEDDEDTPAVKKPKLQIKPGSGLFNLLPPPKNSATLSKPGFMPHILSSKKEKSCITSQSKNSAVKKITPAPSVIPEDQESDEEIPSTKDKYTEESTDISGKNDFFWLDDLASNEKSKEENNSDFSVSKNNSFLLDFNNLLPSTSKSGMQELYHNESKEVSSLHHYQQQSDTFEVEETSAQSPPSIDHPHSVGNYSVAESVNELDLGDTLLRDEEFRKFQGRKGKLENIDIIDVNADDQLTDKNEWLMKNLTEESTHRPSRKKGHMPTQQQKRKHQITYLAFQAKERENDLKNQWAMNNRTRRETQAKYGF